MLTELDTAIGDGDHGENMMRGFKAIEKKLEATGRHPRTCRHSSSSSA